MPILGTTADSEICKEESTHHHVHCALGHDGLEARDLAQALVAVRRVLLKNVQRCVVEVLVRFVEDGGQALLDKRIRAEDELRDVLERMPDLRNATGATSVRAV
jgi:hypothetical protein